MDKFEWQETHANAEPCYLLERTLVSGLCWRMTQMVESGVTPPDARATLAVAPPISGSLAGAFVYGRGIPLRVPWLSDCTVAFIRQQSLSSIDFLLDPPHRPKEKMRYTFAPMASQADS